jgi:hypothetical protein
VMWREEPPLKCQCTPKSAPSQSCIIMFPSMLRSSEWSLYVFTFNFKI